MARQCMVAAISRQLSVGPLASTEKGLQQSTTPALPGNEPTEEVKCEDLEKVAIDVDPEKFFQVGSELLPQRKCGRVCMGFLQGPRC